MIALFAMALMMFMLNVDLTIVNIALPTIAQSLHFPLSEIQWSVNALVLGCMLMVLGGRLADLYGKRRLFFIGSTLFIVASLAASLATNSTLFIIARFVQGVGIALDLPVLYAIPLTLLPKEKHGLVVSSMGMAVALGLIAGPSLGGFICHYLDWRWIFYINLPTGIFALIVAAKCCPADDTRQSKPFNDYWGALLLFVALAIFVMSLTEVQNWGWISLPFIASLIATAILLLIFFRIEAQHSHPLIDPSLFKNQTFKLLNWVRPMYQLVLYSTLLFPTLMMKNLLGYSSVKTGLVMLAMTIIMGVVAIATGKVYQRIGSKRMIAIALSCSTISSALFLRMHPAIDMTSIIIALLFAGIAAGGITSLSPKMVIASAPAEKASVATGIFFTTALIGASIGVGLGGSLLAYCSDARLAQLLPTLDGQQFEHLKLIANGARPLTQAGTYSQATGQAFFFGFKVLSGIWTALSFMALLLTLRLKSQ